jgi:cell division inhibitor SulA
LPHLWWLRPPTPQHALWAAEQLLKAGPGALVLLWSESADERCLRRLQLACEQGHTLAILMRSSRWLSHNSCAALRCLLHVHNAQIQLQLYKCRGSHQRGQQLRWSPGRQQLEAIATQLHSSTLMPPVHTA